MKNRKWICSICEQTLTRKWNAQRHSKTKHGGSFESIILLNDYLISTTTRLIDKKIFNSNLCSNNNEEREKQKTNRDLPFSCSIPTPMLHSASNPDNVKRTWSFRTKETLLDNILEKLIPKYEELEVLLSDLPDLNKKWFLGYIVTQAINSKDPVAFVNNEILNLKKEKICNRMLDNACIFLRLNKPRTSEFLKLALKNK